MLLCCRIAVHRLSALLSCCCALVLSGLQAQARSLSQAISALGSAVKADVEQVAALREAVLYLVRSADTALHTFKRAYAWREATKVRRQLY